MTDCFVASACENPSRDGLEERLARLQPELRAHLAHASRRVQGLDPEDLAQEVLARALHYRERYDAKRALWPWLRQVASRVLVDHRVAAERKSVAYLELDVAAPSRTPELDAREELELVLAALKPVERDVLLRFHQAGESVTEIAEGLDMREGTVKSHLSRARRRLLDLQGRETNDEA